MFIFRPQHIYFSDSSGTASIDAELHTDLLLIEGRKFSLRSRSWESLNELTEQNTALHNNVPSPRPIILAWL